MKIAKLQEVVDLTAKTTIAGKHISAMDAEGKTAVVSMLSKTAKKNENKIVKDAVVAVAYGDACRKPLSNTCRVVTKNYQQWCMQEDSQLLKSRYSSYR